MIPKWMTWSFMMYGNSSKEWEGTWLMIAGPVNCYVLLLHKNCIESTWSSLRQGTADGQGVNCCYARLAVCGCNNGSFYAKTYEARLKSKKHPPLSHQRRPGSHFSAQKLDHHSYSLYVKIHLDISSHLAVLLIWFAEQLQMNLHFSLGNVASKICFLTFSTKSAQNEIW